MSRFRIKRKIERAKLPKKRGSKRCPFCKCNSIVDGRCSSCNTIVDHAEYDTRISELLPNYQESATLMLTLATAKLKKKKVPVEE